MQTVTAHVHPNKSAAIVCPACNKVKYIAANKLKGHRHVLRVRCRCEEVFNVKINFRKHFRKQISLPGTYVITNPPGAGGGVNHIRNISRGGLGFSVSGRNPLQKDQIIDLTFTLNDKKMTQIRKRAKVRSVKNNLIGCQFDEKDELGKELGFFLQF